MDESDALLSDERQPLRVIRRQSTISVAAKWTRRHIVRIDALLVCVPLGIVAELCRWNSTVTLVLNFLAILPLSDIVSNHSDKISDYSGPLVGGLINAAFGNAVELSYGILAIAYGKSHLAQSLMVGSILSDILLVQGACLIAAAGWKMTCHFNIVVVDSLSSLMIITTMALILPTALYATNSNAMDIEAKIRYFSRATSIILLLTYMAYMYFQLWTHKAMFLDEADEDDDGESEPIYEREEPDENSQNETPPGTISTAGSVASGTRDDIATEDPQEEQTKLGLYGAIVVLLASAGAVVNCTRSVLMGTAKASELAGFSQTFMATILVPIASNAPECSAIIIAARHSRMNFAVSVIVGSILQIGLFVLPFLVIVGWTMGKEMTLYLDTSQTSIIFLAVLTVNHLLQDGSYTYLHGVLLIGLYAVFTMAILVLPEE